MAVNRVAILFSTVLGVVLLVACKPPPAQSQVVAPAAEAPPLLSDVTTEVYDSYRFRPVARYRQVGGNASFTLETDHKVWRVDFEIGGREDGAATRANCYVRVQGEMTGNRIDGVIVDGQQRWNGGSVPSGLREVIVLIPGGARIVEDNMRHLCDMGAKGRYKLVDPFEP